VKEAKVDAKETKAEAKADVKEAKAVHKATHKVAKTKAHKDTTVAAATPAK
jgi:hypothetical protein